MSSDVFLWLILAVAVAAVGLILFFRYRPRRELTSPEMLLARTFGRILDGERAEVLDEMRQLYQLSNQDVGVGLALGILFRDLGKNQLAIRTHRSLATRADLDPELQAFIRAELSADYLESGLLDRARNAIDEALALKSGDEFITALGERVLTRLHEWDAAFQLVQAFGKRKRRDVSERLGLLRYEQGAYLWDEERRDEAFAAYKKALAVDAGCLPAYLGCSHYHRRQGKPQKALQLLLKKMAHFQGQEWLALRELMNIAIDMDDHQVFLKAVRQRLEGDESDWRSRAVLARFLMETGAYDDAGRELLLCLKASPQTLRLHQMMWNLMLRGQSWDTFKAYQTQVSKDLVFSDPYACRACTFHAPRWLWRCPSCHRRYSFQERNI